MKDQPSTSDNDDDEPVRFRIPQPPMEEYLVYSEEAGGFIAPGEGSHWDVEAWMREFREELNNLSEEERRKGLISVDELRAAGALDVPAAWRKSLCAERTRQKDLFGDDWQDETEPEDAEFDAGDDSSADEDE